MRPSELKQVSRVRRWGASGEAREIRESANLGLREAAAAVETSPSTLSRWETGTAKPRPESALRWFRFLSELSKDSL